MSGARPTRDERNERDDRDEDRTILASGLARRVVASEGRNCPCTNRSAMETRR